MLKWLIGAAKKRAYQSSDYFTNHLDEKKIRGAVQIQGLKKKHKQEVKIDAAEMIILKAWFASQMRPYLNCDGSFQISDTDA